MRWLALLLLAGCATPTVVTQEVKVPYPVNCTSGLPVPRQAWPLDQIIASEKDIRVIVTDLVEDDAAWRDYAHALEAATAGCRP